MKIYEIADPTVAAAVSCPAALEDAYIEAASVVSGIYFGIFFSRIIGSLTVSSKLMKSRLVIRTSRLLPGDTTSGSPNRI